MIKLFYFHFVHYNKTANGLMQLTVPKNQYTVKNSRDSCGKHSESHYHLPQGSEGHQFGFTVISWQCSMSHIYIHVDLCALLYELMLYLHAMYR